MIHGSLLSLSLTLILSLSDHSLTFSLTLITLLHTYVIGYCSVYDTWNVYFHTFNKGVVYSPAPLLRAGFMTPPVCARGLYLEYWYLYNSNRPDKVFTTNQNVRT